MKWFMSGITLFEGLLVVALAIPLLLEKVPPNAWYGFRTPRTLSNSEVWYSANVGASKILLAFGATLVVLAVILFILSRNSAFSPQTLASVFIAFQLAPVLLLIVAVLIYAIRV